MSWTEYPVLCLIDTHHVKYPPDPAGERNTSSVRSRKVLLQDAWQGLLFLPEGRSQMRWHGRTNLRLRSTKWSEWYVISPRAFEHIIERLLRQPSDFTPYFALQVVWGISRRSSRQLPSVRLHKFG